MITNASTTGLLDARSRSWSAELMEALSIPAELFPALIEPGQVVGMVRADVAARTGLSPQTRAANPNHRRYQQKVS